MRGFRRELVEIDKQQCLFICEYNELQFGGHWSKQRNEHRVDCCYRVVYMNEYRTHE